MRSSASEYRACRSRVADVMRKRLVSLCVWNCTCRCMANRLHSMVDREGGGDTSEVQ
jgi:hypothetical protein